MTSDIEQFQYTFHMGVMGNNRLSLSPTSNGGVQTLSALRHPYRGEKHYNLWKVLDVAGEQIKEMLFSHHASQSMNALLKDVDILQRRINQRFKTVEWKFGKWVYKILVACKMRKINPFIIREQRSIPALERFRQLVQTEMQRIPAPPTDLGRKVQILNSQLQKVLMGPTPPPAPITTRTTNVDPSTIFNAIPALITDSSKSIPESYETVLISYLQNNKERMLRECLRQISAQTLLEFVEYVNARSAIVSTNPDHEDNKYQTVKLDFQTVSPQAFLQNKLPELLTIYVHAHARDKMPAFSREMGTFLSECAIPAYTNI